MRIIKRLSLKVAFHSGCLYKKSERLKTFCMKTYENLIIRISSIVQSA